eukprot:comp24309_c0_seq1/m.60102 comp24309_c0_seq1/g.60102  ORF comp24309_c0_seq1/g.60102 comp24309_c0_seq1/m.60102 type:complete len:555 (-) comp24309_c0_seq1:52-1716(-)
MQHPQLHPCLCGRRSSRNRRPSRRAQRRSRPLHRVHHRRHVPGLHRAVSAGAEPEPRLWRHPAKPKRALCRMGLCRLQARGTHARQAHVRGRHRDQGAAGRVEQRERRLVGPLCCRRGAARAQLGTVLLAHGIQGHHRQRRGVRRARDAGRALPLDRGPGLARRHDGLRQQFARRNGPFPVLPFRRPRDPRVQCQGQPSTAIARPAAGTQEARCYCCCDHQDHHPDIVRARCGDCRHASRARRQRKRRRLVGHGLDGLVEQLDRCWSLFRRRRRRRGAHGRQLVDGVVRHDELCCGQRQWRRQRQRWRRSHRHRCCRSQGRRGRARAQRIAPAAALVAPHQAAPLPPRDQHRRLTRDECASACRPQDLRSRVELVLGPRNRRARERQPRPLAALCAADPGDDPAVRRCCAAAPLCLGELPDDAQPNPRRCRPVSADIPERRIGHGRGRHSRADRKPLPRDSGAACKQQDHDRRTGRRRRKARHCACRSAPPHPPASHQCLARALGALRAPQDLRGSPDARPALVRGRARQAPPCSQEQDAPGGPGTQTRTGEAA